METFLDRPELIWPGKHPSEDEPSAPRITPLPFQVVETINSTRIGKSNGSESSQPTLFDYWQGNEGNTFDEGWKNKIIWGDSRLVVPSLLDKFAGLVKLIYVDPPFKKGYRFDFIPTLGDDGRELSKKRQSPVEEMAYRKTWDGDLTSFLTMMSSQLTLMRELLEPTGSVWVHVDDEAGHYVKVLLDEIFGRSCFINQIIWHYGDKIQGNVNRYADNHNMILVYGRNENVPLDRIKVPLAKPVKRDRRAWSKEEKAIRAVRDETGKIIYDVYHDKDADNVWELMAEPHIWEIGQSGVKQPRNKEYWGYETQKPLELLRRIIESGSKEDELVADFFCGSGTTAVMSEQLHRRWICGDISRWATHVTRKRLLESQSKDSIEILNLGKYERKWWQTAAFDTDTNDEERERILRYVAFVLKLYGGMPLEGLEHIHGKKGTALIHVGAVDAPITIDEALDCIQECRRLNQKDLHILGWDWEMGMSGLMSEEASKLGVNLKMSVIPIDLIADRPPDQVHFFELGHLDIEVIQPRKSKLERQVTLKEFSIPNLDSLLDRAIEEEIGHWSDYVDFWAVDWDYQDDTFNSEWVEYRTPKDRNIELTSGINKYAKSGNFKVMVKVVDIFGNDTSVISEIEV